MIKNRNTITAIILLFTIKLVAQNGSVYTRYGLGDLQFTTSTKNFMLGGNPVAVSNYKYINPNNPATWSSLNATRFEAGMFSSTSEIEDASVSTTYYQTKFNGFKFAFPVQKDYGISMVLGLTPYSIVDYDVEQNLESEEFGNYSSQYKGKGEISKIYFGLSYKLPFGFSIGSTFEYLTGSTDYTSSLIFDDSKYTNSVYTTNYKYRGIGTTLGLLTPDLLKFIDPKTKSELRIGFTYNTFGNVNTDTSFYSQTFVGENTIRNGNIKVEIPAQLGFGLSFNYNSQYRFNADYLYQPWSGFEISNLNNGNLQDLKRYSLGMEYSKARKKFGSFWELVKYRAGLSYEQTQYAINGNGINQLSFYGGISLPLGLGNSVDIGFMYGTRGSVEKNFTKENIFKAMVSVNFGELWFIRRER